MTTWFALSASDSAHRRACHYANSPIDRLVVALVRHHLGRKIIRGTAERPRLVRHPLREAKVGDLEMSMSVEQQVLWFEVSVDDILVVQVFKSQRDLGRIEFGDRVGEALMSRVSVRVFPSHQSS